jgi:uncharacterized membrane protein YhdT
MCYAVDTIREKKTDSKRKRGESVKENRSIRLATLLADVYFNNTIILIIILAVIAFFAQAVAPGQIVVPDWVNHNIIPLFIVVILLEIFFIRTRIMNYLEDIRENTETGFTYQSFRSGEEFDKYLESRFQTAHDVKIIHISSLSSGEPAREREGRNYHKIVKAFIERGGILRRIFSDTSNKEVFQWIIDDLHEYKGHKCFIYFLKGVKVDRISTLGVMIIDENEVCLGGGYVTSFKNPTVAIKNRDLVKFYADYFDHLRNYSVFIDESNLDDLKERQSLLEESSNSEHKT